jgi:S1-C subfamily serine protease
MKSIRVYRDLSTEEQKKIGATGALFSSRLLKGSPAFKAEILAGDVLKRIGDTEIVDTPSLRASIKQFAEKTLDVKVIRNGREVIKTVAFSECGYC